MRAVTTGGGVGAWITSPSMTASARQDTATTVKYGGTGWARATAGSPYGGTLKWSGAKGRSATTVATGRSFAWVSDLGKGRGKAEVWVDGKRVATVSLYAKAAKARAIVWSTTFASSGKHTIVIKVLGTRASGATSARVDVDAFLVLT